MAAMIRTTPFHERTSALNQTGLWEHWSNHLTAVKYQQSEKFEYFAIRNGAGLFDTSPLYKYRFHGPGAERYLAGIMARDPRIPVGRAQYALWCDDKGFVVEDGVLMRVAEDDFLLTAAEPNLAYFRDLADGRAGTGVTIDEVTDEYGVLSIQGPRSREILGSVAPEANALPYFGLSKSKIAKKDVLVSRTGYTGDLGFEVWVPAKDALKVWDAVWKAGETKALTPFGMTALYMARIEAGLILLDVDFRNARFAWTSEDRSTPIELGFGWMFRDLESSDRVFLGREALRREIADKTSRWKITGLTVDWHDWDRFHDAAGLIPPKDHTPVQDEYYIYDDDLKQLGYATSLMYSPMLQRHIALARVPLAMAAPGSRVKLEWPVNHKYEYFDAYVGRLPLFNPERRTA